MKLRKVVSLVFGIFTLLFSCSALAGDKYIKIVGNMVNIRSDTSTESVIVAKALKGDIFEYSEDKNDWYEIFMFSGESRYVHKSLSQFAEYKIELPTILSRRRAIFRKIALMEYRSMEEADRKYPLDHSSTKQDLKRNIDYFRLLKDRYTLDVFHKFNIQSLIHIELSVEGAKNNWLKNMLK